jgi:exosortase A-associated hydrolase 2
MPGPTEEPISIASPAGPLHGMLYRPAGEPAAGVVLCNPVFEEHKATLRPLVDLARELNRNGVAALRFDYRGCGDSPGEFDAFSLSDWIEDIAAAKQAVLEAAPGVPVGIQGVRIGASLALMAALADPDCAFAVLWEPVISGRTYVEQELRKKLMKEMMTFGERRSTREGLLAELEAGRGIDFDGYPFAPRLYRELTALDLLTGKGASPLPVHLVQVSAATKLASPLERLREKLERDGATVETAAVRAPPFWNLVGIVDCPEIIEQTRDWVEGCLRGTSMCSTNPDAPRPCGPTGSAEVRPVPS